MSDSKKSGSSDKTPKKIEAEELDDQDLNDASGGIRVGNDGRSPETHRIKGKISKSDYIERDKEKISESDLIIPARNSKDLGR